MHPSHLRRPAFLLLVSWLGLLFLLRAWGFFAAPPEPSRPPGPAVVEGKVAEHAKRRWGRLEAAFDLTSVDGSPVRERVLLRAPGYSPVAWGAGLRVSGTFEVPARSPLPGRGGWGDYLAGRGIRSILQARDVVPIAPPAAPQAALSAARERLLGAFRERLSPRNAAVLGGLVLGEKSGIDRETLSAFREAGAVHLLVASGSNVGFVLLIAAWLASLTGLARPARLAAGLIAGAAYVLLAGPDAPLVRGFLVTAAGLAGFLLGRNPGAFQGLVLAALAMTLVDPVSAFQPGFQLSFAASLGIVAGLAAWSAPAAWHPAARYPAGVFLASACAQLAVWPVLALHFHEVSAVALLSNVILVPVSGLLLGGGLALSAVDAVGVEPLAALAGWALDGGLDLFCGTVDLFAGLPGLKAVVAAPSAWTLGAYAALLAALWSLPDRRRAARAFACAVAVFVLGVAARVAAPARLELWACPALKDSAASLIRLPEGGFVWLGAPARGLSEAVLGLGAPRLEAVALHCLERRCWSGLERLEIPVAEVWAPPGRASKSLAALRARLEAAGTRWRDGWPSETYAAGGVAFTPQDVQPGRRLKAAWRAQWRGFRGVFDEREGAALDCGVLLPTRESGALGASSDGNSTRC